MEEDETQATQPVIADLPPVEDEDREYEAPTKATSMSARWMVTAWPEHQGPDWDINELLLVPHEYICWGLELTPRTRREHFHVYLRFNQRKRMRQILEMFGTNRIRCFLCKGTEQQCRDYCHSTGKHVNKQALRLSFGENGNFKADEGKQGKRSDLDKIAEDIVAGKPMKEIALENASDYIRYNKGLEAFACVIKEQPPTFRAVQVLWMHGPTGTGKTHRVLTLEEALGGVFTVTSGRNPWDGYNGEMTILLDEWRSTDWPIQTMNRLLDKWKWELPCRYHNKYAAWTRVIICSNDSPSQAYSDEPNQEIRKAFFRRVATACRYVDKREDQGGPTFEEIENSPPVPDFTN